jgi:hypothetical protein
MANMSDVINVMSNCKNNTIKSIILQAFFQLLIDTINNCYNDH